MKRLLGILMALLAWFAAVAIWINAGPPQVATDNADIAIVLGAAVDTDVPSPVFAARIDHAIDLYNTGRVQSLLFTGGRSPADTLSEAAAARDYALAKGVPASAIFLEVTSRTTLQNLTGALPVIQGAGASSALIVSDPLHLRRALVMAGDLGIDARASATPSTRYRSWSTKAPFLLREVYFIHHYWIFGE